MSISCPDHRKKVIFIALRRMTDDRNVIIDGFRYWINNYAGKSFDINSIVAGLVRYLGLNSGEKKKLMVALHVASNKMSEDLPEVPKALLDGVSADKPAANFSVEIESNRNVRKALPPHCTITSSYLQTLTQLLKKHDTEAFEELKDILREEGIDDIADFFRTAIKNWLGNGLIGLELPESTTEEDCKTVAHEIYLFICDVVGPMDADSLLNAAIQKTSSLDEAARFHPRLLL